MVIGFVERRLSTLFSNRMSIESESDVNLLGSDISVRRVDGQILWRNDPKTSKVCETMFIKAPTGIHPVQAA